jgi:membrane protease YdiL (CAAX protease family)
MKNSMNWKLFWILLLASIFGVLAIIPYTLTLQASLLKELPVPLYTLLSIQILENAILFAVFIFVGLYLAKRVDLGLPILESLLEGKEVKTYFKSILAISVALGVLAAILAIMGNFLFYAFAGPLPIQTASPPIWQSFLASFYGGIDEEIAMRLFLMTLLVWIFSKIKRTEGGRPTNSSVWIAIIIAAIIFGIGHLPFASTLTSISPLMAAQIILLNAIGGIVFGWLYWRKGLESAMLSHFSADIVLHVIASLVI